MACQKYANKVGMMHESKGQHIGKAPSLHLFTLQLDSAWESFKRTNVALPASFSHMAWERGYKPTAVASFSGLFLAPPI